MAALEVLLHGHARSALRSHDQSDRTTYENVSSIVLGNAQTIRALRIVEKRRIEPELTVADLARVSVPVLVMAGDDDLVPLSHTAAFFAGLPEAQLAIVPGASHGLPMEHPQEVVGLIERFLGSDVPPVTMMPNLRA